jgi:hypothetical protein
MIAAFGALATVGVTIATPLLEPPVEAAEPPKWIGTVTVSTLQTDTAPTSPKTFTHITTYTLAADAFDTSQTTFATQYDYDRKSISTTIGLISWSVSTGSATGTGGALRASYQSSSSRTGYAINVSGDATFEITTTTWHYQLPTTTVTQQASTQTGNAFVPSVADDKWVLQGAQTMLDSCFGTSCSRTEVTYNLRRLDCTGAPDVDFDDLDECEEFDLGTDPNNPDTDGDGLNDGAEVAIGTNPTNTDTDGDGITDGAEVVAGTDPNDPNSPGSPPPPPPVCDNYPDCGCANDADCDGWTDAEEAQLDTLPTDPSSHPLLTFDYDAIEFAGSGIGDGGITCGTARHDFLEVTLAPTALRKTQFGCVILLGNSVAKELVATAFADDSSLTDIAAAYIMRDLEVITLDESAKTAYTIDVLGGRTFAAKLFPKAASLLRRSSAIFTAGTLAGKLAVPLGGFFVLNQIENDNACVQLLVNVDNGELNVNWSMVYSTTATDDKDLTYAHAYDKKVKNFGFDKLVRNNLNMRCVAGNVEVLAKDGKTAESFAGFRSFVF